MIPPPAQVKAKTLVVIHPPPRHHLHHHHVMGLKRLQTHLLLKTITRSGVGIVTVSTSGLLFPYKPVCYLTVTTGRMKKSSHSLLLSLEGQQWSDVLNKFSKCSSPPIPSLSSLNSPGSHSKDKESENTKLNKNG